MQLLDLAEHSRQYAHWLPFFTAITGQRADDRPLLTRLLENLMTAALAAGLVMWRNDGIQDYRLETIQAAVSQNAEDSREERAQLRAEITALRVELARIAPTAVLPTKKGSKR